MDFSFYIDKFCNVQFTPGCEHLMQIYEGGRDKTIAPIMQETEQGVRYAPIPFIAGFVRKSSKGVLVIDHPVPGRDSKPAIVRSTFQADRVLSITATLEEPSSLVIAAAS